MAWHAPHDRKEVEHQAEDAGPTVVDAQRASQMRLDEALETAVRFSDRYITGRFLPDKAIDVMDEAGARARINAMTNKSMVTNTSAPTASCV